jgi:hypothetical protein
VDGEAIASKAKRRSDGCLQGIIDLPAPQAASGVPGGDRFVVDGLKAGFSGEFAVSRAA